MQQATRGLAWHGLPRRVYLCPSGRACVENWTPRDTKAKLPLPTLTHSFKTSKFMFIDYFLSKK